ncbi:MAG TPA: acetyl-CoA carboxylase biotin carboxylase subunit [Hyphomicrobiaceae bacterium]|nr:acetyl-CoA carboxylase biotin carboxylase subunit [Hyphomicrobiaceae bacterium]
MIKKILIANRGEIACRIIRTARRMGIATVAVYSDADARAMHVRDADEAIHIGRSPATESYLVIDKIIAAAKSSGADAIHPGYGFLSENPDLPDACKAAGIAFIGPGGDAMRALGGKAAAKDIAIKAGVPVVPGYQGRAQDAATLQKEAQKIGYPVMIKAVAGGGGRGMRLVNSAAELPELLDSARREAESAFGNPDVLIEKVVVKPRHIEVQVFGDTHGNAVHLFERDCTLQRRNQKVIEEAPAPGMSTSLRRKICDAAVTLAKSVGYAGAGTVEFLVEGGALDETARWYFIEMNTRLQVEHPVTEEITGLDLVEWQIRVASGEGLPLPQEKIRLSGHAIEIRLCAEDPANGFTPSVGQIIEFRPPVQGTRVETGVASGDAVSPFYDSMIAKLIVSGADRNEAIRQMLVALETTRLQGLKSNLPFLHALLSRDDVQAGAMDTGLIGREIAQLTTAGTDARRVAVGARLLLEERRLASEATTRALRPWATSDAFQFGRPRTTTFPVVVEGKTREAVAHWQDGRLSVSVDGVEGRWPGEQVSQFDAHVWSEIAAAVGDARDGVAYVFEKMQHSTVSWPVFDASQIDDGFGSGAVRAPINGRVAKIFVAAGDGVEKGQRIAIVEAMKMEHVLTAATSGIAARIAVAEGAQVTQGALIAVIEEAATDAS